MEGPVPTDRIILMIDDEAGFGDILGLLCKPRGYRVVQARDGLTGLKLLASEAPDLVILDLALPDVSGKDVCRSIRKRTGVPILVLTANTSAADRALMRQLGADEYVIKPFAAGELIAYVESMLGLGRTRAAQSPRVER